MQVTTAPAVEPRNSADYGRYHGQPAHPAAPADIEGSTFAAELGEIPVLVVYTETAAGVIVDGACVGERYAEASCFGEGQRRVWAAEIESYLHRMAEGAVS